MKTLDVLVTRQEMEQIQTASLIFSCNNPVVKNRLLEYIKEDYLITLAKKPVECGIPELYKEYKKRKEARTVTKQKVGQITCTERKLEKFAMVVKLFTGEQCNDDVLADMVSVILCRMAKKHRHNLDKAYGFEVVGGEYRESQRDITVTERYDKVFLFLDEDSSDFISAIKAGRRDFINSQVEESAPFDFLVDDTVDWGYINGKVQEISKHFKYDREVPNEQLLKEMWSKIIELVTIDGRMPN